MKSLLIAIAAMCFAVGIAAQTKDAPSVPGAKQGQQPPGKGQAAAAAQPQSPATQIFGADYDAQLKLFQTGTLSEAQKQALPQAITQYKAAISNPPAPKEKAMLDAMEAAAAKPENKPKPKSFN